MAKLNLKHVQKIGSYYYFRRAGQPRATLPGIPGSLEFMTAYQKALGAEPMRGMIGAKRTQPGSINAAIVRYLTEGFETLSPATRTLRRPILEKFRGEYGNMPLATMPKHFIQAALSKLAPHTARTWLKTLRHLMQFAVSQNLCADDPTAGIRNPKVPKSDGHHTWDEDEIAQYEAKHVIGTLERLCFALTLYTIQRRSDVILMGRQHVRDGVISIRQQKTKTPVKIPIHPKLQAVLAATPSEHLTFLTTVTGLPFTGNYFSEQFRKWCDAAGLPQECVAHGLRKSGCRRLAELGCSANEIASISGHLTLAEVQRYTKDADRAKMARNAMAKMVEAG